MKLIVFEILHLGRCIGSVVDREQAIWVVVYVVQVLVAPKNMNS
jgi:hypothetical protein